jgi:Protein of unknown function (DUF3303)
MKYICIWNLPHSNYKATVARFLETGGAPPKGVEIVGRWHGMSGQGVMITETDNAKAMFEFRAQWSDLIDMTITPCLEDADAGAVLASMGKH